MKDKFLYIILSLFVFLIAFPLILAFIFSTQTPAEIFSYPPKLTIGSAFLENYKIAWQKYHLGKYLFNTIFVAFFVTTGKAIISFMAATAIVYFSIPFKRAIFLFILFTLMMPTEIMIISLFNIITKLKLANSFGALILPFLASATGTFLFRQHFLQISRDLLDAVKIEGVNPLQFMFKILLPMSKNILAALLLIEFVYVWNQYLWPLVIIRDNSKQLIQIGLRMMTTGQDATNWGVVMAGAIISLLPALLIFFFLQKYFSQGLAFKSEK
ncbi:carbohydrate ABC transporter permease [Thermodesulfatator indicus]